MLTMYINYSFILRLRLPNHYRHIQYRHHCQMMKNGKSGICADSVAISVLYLDNYLLVFILR